MATGNRTETRGLTAATDRYLELVKECPLRPIKSEAELGRATEVLGRLLRRDDLDDAEEDYVDVLGDLIEAYEDIHWPMPSDLEERRGKD